MKLLYEDVPDTLSQLVRTAFIPSEGKKYIVADFSAIEARVIAWFANENGDLMHSKMVKISTVHQQAKCSMYQL